MGQVIELPLQRRSDSAFANGKVAPPRRRKNLEVRSREYLTGAEIEKLLKATKDSGRYGQRDRALIMLMFRHALRVSEAVSLRWDAVDLDEGTLMVNRLKGSDPSRQPLRGPELRELRQLRRDWPGSPYLFISERGGPMKTANVRKLVARIGRAAGFEFPIHPHMLRHSLGHYLADRGEDTRAIQDYLGHCNIQHTVRYTKLSPNRFRNFFDD